MTSERVEAILVPSFLQLVAGRSGTWVTLGDLQKAVQSHKLTFPNTLLEPMFVEADFRNSGRLSAQELVAALSGRYPKRKYTESWRRLLSLLLRMPGKQLNFLMQNHVCTKRPSTAATSRGTFNADVHLDQHSTTQKWPAAAAPQARSPTSQCSPQSLRGSVRPASAGVTLRGGKAVTGHAALFKPGGLLAGLVQGGEDSGTVTFGDAQAFQRSISRKPQRPQTAPAQRQHTPLAPAERRRIACCRPRSMLRPSSAAVPASSNGPTRPPTAPAWHAPPQALPSTEDGGAASAQPLQTVREGDGTRPWRGGHTRGDPSVDHATLSIPPEQHAKAQAKPVPPVPVQFGNATLPVQPLQTSALETLRRGVAVPATQPRFVRQFRGLRADHKRAFLGEQLDISSGSGFALCSTPPVAATELSKFVDSYVAWRQVKCWTRADEWDTWLQRQVSYAAAMPPAGAAATAPAPAEGFGVGAA